MDMKAEEDIRTLQGKIADTLFKISKESMLKLGCVPGTALGYDAMGEEAIAVPFGWVTPKERTIFLNLLRMMFRVRGVILYAIANEGWAKSIPIEKEKDIEIHQWGDLAKDPERYEVISVLVVSAIHVEARGCKIIREKGEDSKVTGFEDEPLNSFTDGDLTNLIPRRKARVQG